MPANPEPERKATTNHTPASGISISRSLAENPVIFLKTGTGLSERFRSHRFRNCQYFLLGTMLSGTGAGPWLSDRYEMPPRFCITTNATPSTDNPPPIMASMPKRSSKRM
ncbi:hypothetical protein GCM10009104_16660 [Marinobacterium maritimum]|uniref:Uncharacterized protein n=1 Tax=Marinobacterium maritimum TaxID=500162 RepID=A0ABP3TBB3_9GAMM